MWAYTPPTGGTDAAEIRVESNGTTTTFSNSSSDFSNKEQIVIFDTDGVSIGAVPDHTEDHITITTPGCYEVTAHFSITGGTATVISFAIFKNDGATKLTTRASRRLAVGTDVGAASLSGIAELEAGDTIELWVQNETSTLAMTMEDGSLCVKQI